VLTIQSKDIFSQTIAGQVVVCVAGGELSILHEEPQKLLICEEEAIVARSLSNEN